MNDYFFFLFGLILFVIIIIFFLEVETDLLKLLGKS